MELLSLLINAALLIATAGAAAVAWWQAIGADRSRDEARKSEALALQAQLDASAALSRANEIARTSMRAPFAAALTRYASSLLAVRLHGGDASKQLLMVNAEHNQRLTETGLASGEDVTRLSSWVAAYSIQFEFDKSDPSTMIRRSFVVDDRLRRWIKDPEAVMAEILRDPQADLLGFRGFEHLNAG